MTFEEFVISTQREGLFICYDNSNHVPWVGNSKSIVVVPQIYWLEAVTTDAYPKERKKLCQKMTTDRKLLMELFKAYEEREERKKSSCQH